MSKLIEFRDVTLGYGKSPVLQSLSFTIGRGDFIGFVGPNGAGKSTILKAILGMLRPIAGEIIYHSEADLRFGYVPQRQVVDEVYPLTLLDVVLMGRYGLLGPLRKPGKADSEKAMEGLDCVGLPHLASSAYSQLSGGQKQRGLIARALASEPEVLVLDEPTTDMDIASERALMDLIESLHSERSLTVIVVSHTIPVVANYAEKIAFVGDSVFQLAEVSSAVTSENLSRLYCSSVQVCEIGGSRVIL